MALGHVAVLIVIEGHAAACDKIHLADGMRAGKVVVILAGVVALGEETAGGVEGVVDGSGCTA